MLLFAKDGKISRSKGFEASGEQGAKTFVQDTHHHRPRLISDDNSSTTRNIMSLTCSQKTSWRQKCVRADSGDRGYGKKRGLNLTRFAGSLACCAAPLFWALSSLCPPPIIATAYLTQLGSARACESPYSPQAPHKAEAQLRVGAFQRLSERVSTILHSALPGLATPRSTLPEQ